MSWKDSPVAIDISSIIANKQAVMELKEKAIGKVIKDGYIQLANYLENRTRM